MKKFEIHMTWRDLDNKMRDELEQTCDNFAQALALTQLYNNESLKYNSVVRYYWIAKEDENEL